MIHDLLNSLRRLWRPLVVLAVVAVGFTLSASTAHAAPILQEPEGSAGLIDLVNRFLAIASLAPFLIPLAALRNLIGGLPALPLPNGKEISAGRWFSWLVGAGLVAFGHTVGWLPDPTSAENLQLWWATEWATLSLLANYIYDKVVAPPEPEPAIHTAFGR